MASRPSLFMMEFSVGLCVIFGSAFELSGEADFGWIL